MQEPGQRARSALSANLRAILEHDQQTARSWALAKHIDPRAVQRALAGKHATTLDVIAKIAAAAGLEAWHLLAPGLDPTNPPVRTLNQHEREFYARVRADFLKLNPQ